MNRMMIVDDERWIVEGLKCQLDWRALGVEIVCTAMNGEEALARCKLYAPHIILADIRMPVMDGLRFAEIACAQMPDCAVIIMSGYADFEYAQRAMRFGVTSFLTKPIDRGELESAVIKAIQVIGDRRALRELNGNSAFAAQSEERWRRLLNEEELPEGGRVFAVELSAQPLAETVAYMVGCVANRCRFFLQHPDSDQLYFGVCSREQARDEAMLRHMLGHLIAGLGMGANAVIGARLEPQRGIDHCAEHMRLIFDSIRGLQQNEVICEDAFNAMRSAVSIPYGQAERLIEAVDDLDQTAADERMAQLRPFLLTSLNYEHGLLLQRLLSGLDALLRGYQTGIDQLFTKHISLVNNLGAGIPREKEYLILEDGIRRSIALLRERRASDGARAVQSVRAYIDAHYGEDLSLAALAARFFIAPTHLSRAFKKSVGVNLNRYIRQTRLHHAAILLSNTELKTFEVSERVGYDNPDYFMKLFREEYNMTPSGYRKMISGKIIE